MGSDDFETPPAPKKRIHWLVRIGWAVLAIVVVALGYLWLTREQIAGDLIDDYLEQSGLEATYEIASVGPRKQVVENVIIGDPAAPDLIIDRISATITYSVFEQPGIGGIVIERPRLYGSLRAGNVSFGALDAFLFADTEDAQGLPALDITIVNGKARLETDYGLAGAYLEGEGRLDNGFAGKLALTVPGAGIEGCSAARATAFGDLVMEDGAPRFTGPVRLRRADCGGASIESADIAATLSTDSDFAKLEGTFDVTARNLSADGNTADTLEGKAGMSLRDGALVFDHDLTMGTIETGYARLGSLRADGALRSARKFTQSAWNAQIEGEGVALHQNIGETLASAREASAGTLFEALLAKVNRNLDTAINNASLSGNVTWRSEGDAMSFIVPEARLRSPRGQTVLAISRFGYSREGGRAPWRLSGNFLTAGAGLPRITGRMEQLGKGPLGLRMAMEEFGEGDNSLALPSLSVRQERSGAFVFAGQARASGVFPGGSVRALEMPLNGQLGTSGRLVLGPSCENVKFAQFAYYNLDLQGGELELCPPQDRAMLEYGDALDIGFTAKELVLDGTISRAPARFTAASAEVSYPGGFDLGELTATFGTKGNAARLTSTGVTGEFVIGEDGESELVGRIAKGSAKLDPVPLDLDGVEGEWRYAGSILTLSDASFTLTERTDQIARFEPLFSTGAQLRLANNAITASADLTHQLSGTSVTLVDITHDLGTGAGEAVLDVPGIAFGPTFRLQDLTYLAQGVIAYTQGVVSGEGRIAWTSDEVTSSGAFRSDGLDLAAAFGPVRDLKGEVRFADLLALTTEPGQTVEIGSINPGIEALDGRVQYSIENGTNITIEDARWPFMGGELIMRPVRLRYGTEEDQRYIFEVIALDAAKFVTQMELTNIGATGTFDGTLPIIFDANGDGRIEGGNLDSRAPGGNISYLGELIYEDMGAISNFAFQALRSLDYRDMGVVLDGDLAGEIITRFTIDGVRQGANAERNFITRRLAKLPIRFKVNVRSENFYELATMVRTFWDPDALPGGSDAVLREIGADPKSGEIVLPPASVAPAPDPQLQAEPIPQPQPDPDQSDGGDDNAVRRDELPVQPSESEISP